MCVCTAVGMCSSTCVLCTAFRMSTRANVPSLPYPLRSSLGYHGRCTYSPVLVPRTGTSFVQCFAWSAKRGQMYLVCPTPCAVRLGITGAEYTRPCWYLCWYLFQRGQMCLVCPTPCAVRLGITGAEHTRPCWYLCWYLFHTVLRLVSPGNVSLARARTRTGTPLAQFAWVSRALYILARVDTSCWYLFCTVLRLVSQTQANVPSLPYPLRSLLGYHGR